MRKRVQNERSHDADKDGARIAHIRLLQWIGGHEAGMARGSVLLIPAKPVSCKFVRLHPLAGTVR